MSNPGRLPIEKRCESDQKNQDDGQSEGRVFDRDYQPFLLIAWCSSLLMRAGGIAIGV